MGKIGIIGGGISGLSSVYYLKTLLPAKQLTNKIVLLEANDHLGGWIQSNINKDGRVFESGPRSLRAVVNESGFNVMKLVEDLNLSSEVISITRKSSAAKYRYIYANDKMHVMANNLTGLLKDQPLFQTRLLNALIKEYKTKSEHLTDESVYDFATKRLGPKFAAYAFDPLCRGVYAGDAKKLSMKSSFPPVYNFVANHGSIVGGAMKSRKAKKPFDINECDLAMKSKAEKWSIWSLNKGLGHLPKTLESWIKGQSDVEVKTNEYCKELRFGVDGKAEVITDKDNYEFDYVFSTIPANSLAALLPASHSNLKYSLQKINSAHVGVVNLEYDSEVLPHQGFGYLIPSCEPSDNLGVVYDSCVFPQHNNKSIPQSTRLTVMLGGEWFESVFGDVNQLSSDKLLEVSLSCIRKQINVTNDPISYRSLVLKNAIPQYYVGHSDILNDIDRYIKDCDLPIDLLGASYRGVSVGDCVLNAKKSVEKFKEKNIL